MSAKHTPGPWRVSNRCYDWSRSDGPLIVATVTDDEDEELDVQVAGIYERNTQSPNAPGAKRAAANAALISEAPAMVAIIRDLLSAYDEERMAIDVMADAGCIECTVGTVPNNRNTGLCAFHRARALLAKVSA